MATRDEAVLPNATAVSPVGQRAVESTNPCASVAGSADAAGLPATSSAAKAAAVIPAARMAKADIMITTSHRDRFGEHPHRTAGKLLGLRHPTVAHATHRANAVGRRPAGEFLENFSLIYLPSQANCAHMSRSTPRSEFSPS